MRRGNKGPAKEEMLRKVDKKDYGEMSGRNRGSTSTV